MRLEHRSTKVVSAVILASCLAACAWTYKFEPDAPVVATLPVGSVGVRDARVLFGGLMERELRRELANPQNGPVGSHLQIPGGEKANDEAVAAVVRKASANVRGTSVLVIPGIFGDCVDDQSVPFGDGRSRRPVSLNYTEAYAQYANEAEGLEVRALQISGRASSEANGQAIAQAIKAEASRPEVLRIVVIAYSKGLADTLHAIASLVDHGVMTTKLKAVVSVAGVVMGTPLADRYASLYEMLGARISPLGCPVSEGGELRSLGRNERQAWLAGHALPGSVQYYSIVAHASPNHVSPGLRAFYAVLSRFDGRNDGQVIAADAMLPDSDLLAVVNSDHWMFVLPLAAHSSALVRNLASAESFPREALFRSMLGYVLGTLR